MAPKDNKAMSGFPLPAILIASIFGAIILSGIATPGHSTSILGVTPPVSDPNGPYSGTEGVALTFAGSGSYDPDGSIAAYAWNFGDGDTGTGVSPSHTYAQDGTYTVSLTVTDNGGLTDTDTTTATIADTILPRSISNLQNVTGATWINWTWNNPSDVDFNYTSVYIEGVWKTNTSYPFFNATALTPGSSYEISTHTVDHVGNINTTWVNQTTTTLPLPDTTPPDTEITAGPSGTIGYNAVTFEWTGSDDVTTKPDLEYSYKKLDGLWSAWASDASVTYTDLSNGAYTFMVKARDEAENEDPTPASRSFTVSITTSGGGGGGGGVPRDTDNDSYSDVQELIAGTDPNDPNDYPGKLAATPTLATTITPPKTTTQTTTTTPQPTLALTVPPPLATSIPVSATQTLEKSSSSGELAFIVLLAGVVVLSVIWVLVMVYSELKKK